MKRKSRHGNKQASTEEFAFTDGRHKPVETRCLTLPLSHYLLVFVICESHQSVCSRLEGRWTTETGRKIGNAMRGALDPGVSLRAMAEQEPLLSEAERRAIAAEHLGREDVGVVGVEVRPLSGPRTGFLGDHLKLTMTVQLAGDEELVELPFFAKCMPSMPIHREYVESSRFYEKETAFYGGLLRELRDAQGDGGTDRWVPRYLLARPDLLVLEDLTARGFTVFDNQAFMDIRECEAALRELARFHAASMILEECNRAAGETRSLADLHPAVLEERFSGALRRDPSKGWFPASIRSALPLIERLPKYRGDFDLCNHIRQKLPDAFRAIHEIIKTPKPWRKVVAHGDIWASNILLRKNSDGTPDAVRFVDLQIVRYAPPATDVLILLHTLTSVAFRQEHGRRMYGAYYEEVARELRKHGLDPQALFPRKEFNDSCAFYKVLGVTVAAACSQMTLLRPGFTDDIFRTPERFFHFMLDDRSEEVLANFESDPVYRSRVTEAMQEFIDTCILNQEDT